MVRHLNQRSRVLWIQRVAASVAAMSLVRLRERQGEALSAVAVELAEACNCLRTSLPMGRHTGIYITL